MDIKTFIALLSILPLSFTSDASRFLTSGSKQGISSEQDVSSNQEVADLQIDLNKLMNQRADISFSLNPEEYKVLSNQITELKASIETKTEDKKSGWQNERLIFADGTSVFGGVGYNVGNNSQTLVADLVRYNLWFGGNYYQPVNISGGYSTSDEGKLVSNPASTFLDRDNGISIEFPFEWQVYKVGGVFDYSDSNGKKLFSGGFTYGFIPRVNAKYIYNKDGDKEELITTSITFGTTLTAPFVSDISKIISDDSGKPTYGGFSLEISADKYFVDDEEFFDSLKQEDESMSRFKEEGFTGKFSLFANLPIGTRFQLAVHRDFTNDAGTEFIFSVFQSVPTSDSE
ncbi:hypothetical protein [Photobacterium satsumensis]|uniref:hypothetical protein n=1 Tax=Photobacterium satsumensis TaxID=2910239 RepID=UPI003D0EC42F